MRSDSNSAHPAQAMFDASQVVLHRQHLRLLPHVHHFRLEAQCVEIHAGSLAAHSHACGNDELDGRVLLALLAADRQEHSVKELRIVDFDTSNAQEVPEPFLLNQPRKFLCGYPPVLVLVQFLEDQSELLGVGDVPRVLLRNERHTVGLSKLERLLDEQTGHDVPCRKSEEHDVGHIRRRRQVPALGQHTVNLPPLDSSGAGLEQGEHGGLHGTEMNAQVLLVVGCRQLLRRVGKDLHKQEREDTNDEHDHHDAPHQVHQRAENAIE
mmetsp:Transcript_67960/g.196873  ORF Transcript_67960/g.196873 Transcript_67960/m.196873 type:complete len:267 (-) Transcript_67960:468-1268(-)